MALALTKDNFEQEVLKSDKPVMVDFWAPWCGPCRMLGPVVDEIAAEQTDFVVGKVNIDEEQELAQKYDVMTIPTVIIFKNGEPVETSIGVKPKQALIDMVGI